MNGITSFFLITLLFAIILITLNFLLHKLFNKEYEKTIQKCTHHVIGRISENNFIWGCKYPSQDYRNRIYHIILEYIFTVNGIQYEKTSIWKLRTR